MRTWQNFKASVLDRLTVDADRLGAETITDKKLCDGVRDLQSYIPALRKGHSGYYYRDDLETDGCVSKGLLPEGAMLRDGYYLITDSRCIQQPLVPYDWQNRYDLICGKAAITNGFFISIGPNDREFLVYPAVTSDAKLLIFWDGIKAEFADDDNVFFDEMAAEAVASYVKATIAREVDKDLVLHRSYWTDYAGGDGKLGQRTNLYLAKKRESEIETPVGSPQPVVMCGGECEAEAPCGPPEGTVIGNDEQTATCASLGMRAPAPEEPPPSFTVEADHFTIIMPDGGDPAAYKAAVNSLAFNLAKSSVAALGTCVPLDTLTLFVTDDHMDWTGDVTGADTIRVFGYLEFWPEAWGEPPPEGYATPVMEFEFPADSIPSWGLFNNSFAETSHPGTPETTPLHYYFLVLVAGGIDGPRSNVISGEFGS